MKEDRLWKVILDREMSVETIESEIASIPLREDGPGGTVVERMDVAEGKTALFLSGGEVEARAVEKALAGEGKGCDSHCVSSDPKELASAELAFED